VYFDTIFDHGLDTKIQFGTGPADDYTHWKQTVFYLNDIMNVTCGDTLSGTITSKPNKGNPRDLDITIDYVYDIKGKRVSGTQFYRLRLIKMIVLYTTFKKKHLQQKQPTSSHHHNPPKKERMCQSSTQD